MQQLKEYFFIAIHRGEDYVSLGPYRDLNEASRVSRIIEAFALGTDLIAFPVSNKSSAFFNLSMVCKLEAGNRERRTVRDKDLVAVASFFDMDAKALVQRVKERCERCRDTGWARADGFPTKACPACVLGKLQEEQSKRLSNEVKKNA